MYTTLIKWQPYTGPRLTDRLVDRLSNFADTTIADKFKTFLDAGLVSNTPGPNCYIQEEDDGIVIFNATWTTTEAAQEWVDYIKALRHDIVRTEVGSITP